MQNNIYSNSDCTNRRTNNDRHISKYAHCDIREPTTMDTDIKICPLCYQGTNNNGHRYQNMPAVISGNQQRWTQISKYIQCDVGEAGTVPCQCRLFTKDIGTGLGGRVPYFVYEILYVWWGRQTKAPHLLNCATIVV